MKLTYLAVAALLGLTGMQPRSAEYRAVSSVDTVDVTPAQDTVFRRGAATLVARVVDSVGRKKSATITWTSRDTSVIKAVNPHTDSTGFYSVTVRNGADTGRTYVVATTGSKKDSSLVVARNIICSATTLASLNMQPDSTTAHRTDTLGFSMHPKSQCGGAMNGINPTFSGSGAGLTVSRVDSLYARAIATDSSGTAYVKAVSGSIRDSVKVKLKPAP